MSLTKKEIVSQLAESQNLTKSQAEGVLGFLSDLIQQEISQGNELVLPNVGRFSIKSRAARTGRNPRTGETLQIAATSLVKFSPAKALRDAAAGQTAD